MLGGGPAAMRAAIENAYPALVGSAPATVNASQNVAATRQDLIFGRQATGPGLGTSGYLGSRGPLSRVLVPHFVVATNRLVIT
jgi:hypothetical protein